MSTGSSRNKFPTGEDHENSEYLDREFLEAIEKADLPTSSNLADIVGCSRGTAYFRLNDLWDEGVVDRYSSSNGVKEVHLWEITDN